MQREATGEICFLGRETAALPPGAAARKQTRSCRRRARRSRAASSVPRCPGGLPRVSGRFISGSTALDRPGETRSQHKVSYKHRKLFIIIIVVIVLATTIFISQSGSPVPLGDFHPWALPAERLGGGFFPKPHVEAVVGGLGPLYSADYKRSLL